MAGGGIYLINKIQKDAEKYWKENWIDIYRSRPWSIESDRSSVASHEIIDAPPEKNNNKSIIKKK